MAEAECLASFAGGDYHVGDGEIHDALHPIVSFDRPLAMAQWPHHWVHLCRFASFSPVLDTSLALEREAGMAAY
jgi:hypothetical protein